jgi:hypothetical protein
MARTLLKPTTPSPEGARLKTLSSHLSPQSLATLTLSLCLSGAASAATLPTVACDDASLVNPLYGIGGSAQTPLIKAIARKLAAQTPPITVVYASPGACLSAQTLVSATGTFTTSATYWNAAGDQGTCNPPPAGVTANFGVQGVFPLSCSGVTQQKLTDKNIADFQGPVLAWDLFVNKNSTQSSISAEAAYLVFGFVNGGAYPLSPWTDKTQVIIRNSSSAAQIAIATALGIPAASINGTTANPNTNAGSVANVQNATTPEASLGFASSDVADGSRSAVKTLAYQHFGQSTGYWPDSSPTAFDKSNVRSGQYYLWSQTHVLAPVDATGTPTNPNTQRLVNFILPTTQTVETLTTVITTGNIPQCAMNAWRDSDLGPIKAFQPDSPCVGIYEKVATAATSHAVCTTSVQCGGLTPKCRYGFCEVQ